MSETPAKYVPMKLRDNQPIPPFLRRRPDDPVWRKLDGETKNAGADRAAMLE